jgi:hypothetical protein
MGEVMPPHDCEDRRDDPGCAYVVEVLGERRTCGAPRRLTSSYCPRHHALCYLVSGSKAEDRRLQEVEALASAVGGRRGRQSVGPSRQFLERLEHAVRGNSCPKRS